MLRKRLYFDPAQPQGSVREQIEALAGQIKEEPQNQVPLLKLIQLYGRIWTKTHQAELIGRLIQCLKRSLQLEQGQYVKQTCKVIRTLLAHAREQKLSNAQAELEKILAQYQEKFPQRSAPDNAEASPPVEAVEVRPPSTEELPPPSPEENKPKSFSDDPIIQTAEEGEPPPTEEPIPPQPQAVSSPKEEDFLISTSEEEQPAPSGPEDSPSAEQEDQMLDRVDPEKLRAINVALEAEDIGALIELYSTLDDQRIKRRVVDGMLAHLEDWRIEPLLAVAALERDREAYRYFERSLLRHDKETIAQMIELENYSPDLQKVGVTILAQLRLRSAMVKLERALEIDDPIVQSVALHGIGRFGKRAQRSIGKLVDIACQHPNAGVREAAAQALNAMDHPAAFRALDQKSRQQRLKPEVFAELEEMRRRYYKTEEEKEEKEKEGKKNKSEGLSPAAAKNIKNAVVLLVMLVLLGGIFYFRILPELRPPELPPQSGMPFPGPDGPGGPGGGPPAPNF